MQYLFIKWIMDGLPTLESRELILRTLLSKKKVAEGINYNELAILTEGYNGSDLKNLCSTVAYRPVREMFKKETLKELVAASFAVEGSGMNELKQRNRCMEKVTQRRNNS